MPLQGLWHKPFFKIVHDAGKGRLDAFEAPLHYGQGVGHKKEAIGLFLVQDFLDAVAQGRKPLVDAAEGRRTVELFTAIYRSTRDNAPVKFPLK